MEIFRIDVYNLHYVVKIPNSKYIHIIEYMVDRLSTVTFRYDHRAKRTVREVDKVFASVNNEKLEYRFNINTIKDFILTLSHHYVKRENIHLVRHELPKAEAINITVKDFVLPKDYQEKYLEIITNDDKVPYKLVDLYTGYGKTVIAALVIQKLNVKTMILVAPKFIDKWIFDLQNLMHVRRDEFYVVQGSDSLVSLMNIVREEKCNPYKFVILSIRTALNYVTAYEEVFEDEFTYPVIPNKLLEILGMGLIINDETHMEFHAVYKIALFLNTTLFLGLSATLENNDRKINYMYNTMFPTTSRISGLVEYKRYVETIAASYDLSDLRNIRISTPQGYNHTLFEKNIIRNSVFLKQYMNMIVHYLKEGYLDVRVNGDKAIIFVASIRFATILTNHLSKLYPHLDVRRYVEDDDYDNIMEADISVTTVLSAGTALDVPNLITVLQTVSISSLQANKQSFGRLRNIEGKTLRYYCFYAKNIHKQKDMYKTRKDILYKYSKTWNETHYHNIVHTR